MSTDIEDWCSLEERGKLAVIDAYFSEHIGEDKRLERKLDSGDETSIRTEIEDLMGVLRPIVLQVRNGDIPQTDLGRSLGIESQLVAALNQYLGCQKS